jgi:hypothetical protein
MQNEQDYIGESLSDCPDGTDAVVTASFLRGQEVRRLQDWCVYDIKTDGSTGCKASSIPSDYTVVHIIKLGKPRPETFADEEPGVAWEDRHGNRRFRNSFGEMIFISADGLPAMIHSNPNPGAVPILPDWTRLGRITGMTFEEEGSDD